MSQLKIHVTRQGVHATITNDGHVIHGTARIDGQSNGGLVVEVETAGTDGAQSVTSRYVLGEWSVEGETEQ